MWVDTGFVKHYCKCARRSSWYYLFNMLEIKVTGVIVEVFPDCVTTHNPVETLLYNRLTVRAPAGRAASDGKGGRGERSRCSLPGGVMNNVWRQIGCGGLVGWQQGIDDHKGVRQTTHIVGCYVQLTSTAPEIKSILFLFSLPFSIIL